MDKFNELITNEEKGINRELLKKHFNSRMPTAMLKALYNLNDRKKNKELVNITKTGLSDLANEIENMSEKEKEIEKPY